MPIQDSTVICGYQSSQRILPHGYSASINNHNQNVFTGCSLSKDQYSSGDLVSLSWLQKGNILQITPLDGEEDSRNSFMRSCNATYNNNFAMRSSDNSATSEVSSIANRIPLSSAGASVITSNFVASNAFTNAYCQGLTKPCFSYTHLIFMAIESTSQKCMTVNQIYNWCETNFPFYKHAGAGWKNSLRHNLSINKSFKRLPRDGRGPGRGAYWAVEPRERPNLIDAIKRNPWNVNGGRERAITRPLSCNQAIESNSFICPDSYRSTNDFSPSSVNGLPSNCTDGLLLRNESGTCNYVLSKNIGQSNTSFNLMESTEFKLESSTYKPTEFSCDQTQSIDHNALPSTFIPMGSIECNCNSITINNESSMDFTCPEEQENYTKMIKLLIESSPAPTSISSNLKSVSPVLNSTNETNPATFSNVDSKTEPGTMYTKRDSIKQKRKSSLKPTSENMCNECKENKASTCRSCQIRLWQTYTANSNLLVSKTLPYFNRLDSHLTDEALQELVELPDLDQEPGPAGGPALGLKSVKHEVIDGNLPEVFITPAPYLDHEYSHCQKQLRRPEESRIVEIFNAKYRKKRLQILRNLSNCKNTKTNLQMYPTALDVSTEDSAEENPQSVTERYDQNSTECDSDTSSKLSHHLQNNFPVCSNSGSYSYLKRCRNNNKKSLELEDKFFKGVAVKRGRGRPLSKTKINMQFDKPSRRSTRTIRAPKRPYEDNPVNSMDFSNGHTMKSKRNLYNECNLEEYLLDNLSYRINPPSPINNSCRSRLIPRFVQSQYNLPIPNDPIDLQVNEHDLTVDTGRNSPPDEDSTDDFFGVDSDNSEPQIKKKNKLTYKIRHSSHQTMSNLPNNDQSEKSKNLFLSKIRLNNVKQRVRNEKSYESFAHLTKSDAIDQRKLHTSSPLTMSESMEDYHKKYSKDVATNSKSNTTENNDEAAHLLLGISQMQNFQRQSGYLSLDSSGVSNEFDEKVNTTLDQSASNLKICLP